MPASGKPVRSPKPKKLVQTTSQGPSVPTLKIFSQQELSATDNVEEKYAVVEFVTLLEIPHILEMDITGPEDNPEDLYGEMRSLFKRNRVQAISNSRARSLSQGIHSPTLSKCKDSPAFTTC